MSKGPIQTQNSESALATFVYKLSQHIKDPLYRNSYFLMANTVVISAFGYCFLIIITRYLYSVEDVGLANAIISAISLISTFSLLGLDAFLIRYLPKSGKPNDMINFSFSFSAVTSLLIAGIFVLGIHIWSPSLNFIRDNPKFAVCFIVFAIFLTLFAMTDCVFIAKRTAKFVLIKNTIFSLIKLPLPFILVFFFKAFGIVGSWGIATVIALIISVLLFLPRVQKGYKAKPTLDFSIVKGKWHYTMGSYLISTLGGLQTLIMPIIIVNRVGAAENAYYYTAWMLASLLFIVPGAVCQSLFAEGSHFEESLDANVRRSYKFIFLLLIPLILLFVFAGKWLLLAFGENYSEGGLKLLQILSLSGLFAGINSVYYTVLRVRNRITELIALCSFTMLAILIGSYFIAPTRGIIGVGYVLFSVSAIVSIYVTSRLMMRHRRQPKV